MKKNHEKLAVPLSDSESIQLALEARGRGPLLVIVQAGAAGIEGSAAIAPHLEQHFTVVSYDRRGLGGSPLPADARPTIADHADDVARIIAHLASDRRGAFVFGVSIGGLIGLELVRRHPQSVVRLVAHEPSLLELLAEPLRSELRAEHAKVERVFAERGLDAALQVAAHLGQIDPADREPDVAQAAPTPEVARNLEFFLAHDAAEMRQHDPHVDELVPHASRLVVSGGRSAPDRWAHAIAVTLAKRLGAPLAEMPGGHIGYLQRPRAVAAALVDLYR